MTQGNYHAIHTPFGDTSLYIQEGGGAFTVCAHGPIFSWSVQTWTPTDAENVILLKRKKLRLDLFLLLLFSFTKNFSFWSLNTSSCSYLFTSIIFSMQDFYVNDYFPLWFCCFYFGAEFLFLPEKASWCGGGSVWSSESLLAPGSDQTTFPLSSVTNTQSIDFFPCRET